MLGVLLTAVGFGSLAFGSSTAFVIATVVVWTFGEMITFPVATAFVADIAPSGRNGEYMGAFSSVISLALVVGPSAGVAALDRFGPGRMWSGVLGVGIIAVAVLFLAKPHAPDGPSPFP
jgi:MFS family permease